MNQVQKVQYEIPGSAGRAITVDVTFQTNHSTAPLVIFVHGFKGFKDWGHFNLLGQKFAECGFVFLKFNFSHNGTTPDKPLEFADLEAFGHNNYIFELNDLTLVIDHMQSCGDQFVSFNKKEIYLIGHSRGGGISILQASSDKRVKKIVTWASVCDFLNRNSKDTIRQWQEKGVVYTRNARTGQQMPLYRQFHDAIVNNTEKLDIQGAAASLGIPFLIIHGTNDEAVSYHEAETLKQACTGAELILIDGAGHTFGAAHPFTRDQLPSDGEQVFNATIDFLKLEMT